MDFFLGLLSFFLIPMISGAPTREQLTKWREDDKKFYENFKKRRAEAKRKSEAILEAKWREDDPEFYEIVKKRKEERKREEEAYLREQSRADMGKTNNGPL